MFSPPDPRDDSMRCLTGTYKNTADMIIIYIFRYIADKARCIIIAALDQDIQPLAYTDLSKYWWDRPKFLGGNEGATPKVAASRFRFDIIK